MNVKRLIVILLYFIVFEAAAQVEVTYPANRMVFQRNKDNRGTVFIGGTFNSNSDKIEARLVPVQGGSAVDWTVIDNGPSNAIFTGSLTADGGWYRLEVRSSLGGVVNSSSSIEKVGVGEVFLVSGQSNAQGYFNYGQKGAQDDRVNAITNFFSYGSEKPYFPEFSQLRSDVRIAPLGQGAWCWGELGDKLVRRLNVPVLFINAAWEGFHINAFRISAEGQSGRNVYSGYVAAPGYPYNSLKDALNYYINSLGIRAVLWHQGEADNYLSTSASQYANDLSFVIGATRQHLSKNISWVVSRVSRDDRRTSYQPVIDGQNTVINNNSNVFPGPETDNISDRVDGVHFSASGLGLLAEYWSNYLGDAFFQNSQPQMANAPLRVNANCNPSSSQPIGLNMPGAFSAYEWSTGTRNASVIVGNGSYQGKAFDGNGNVYYTPKLNYFQQLYANKPSISASGATSFCDGKTISLTSSIQDGILWSNGFVSRTIVTGTPGSYTVTSKNAYGCQNTSDPLQIVTFPLPQPVITASGRPDICSDSELTLTSNLSSNIQWSNGLTMESIKVRTSGDYTLKATNEFGCENTTAPLKVTVYDTPLRPAITQSGAFTLSSITGGDVQNLNYEWKLGTGILNNNKDILKVRETGSYSLNVFKSYTLADKFVLRCTSPVSSVINFLIDPFEDGISIYPNPLEDGLLKIETLEDIDHADVIIYDLAGRLVSQYYVDVFDSPKIFDISKLPSSQYIVMVKNNRFKLSKRILKI